MAKRLIQWQVTRYFEAELDLDDDWTHDALYDLEDFEHERDKDEARDVTLEEEL